MEKWWYYQHINYDGDDDDSEKQYYQDFWPILTFVSLRAACEIHPNFVHNWIVNHGGASVK